MTVLLFFSFDISKIVDDKKRQIQNDRYKQYMPRILGADTKKSKHSMHDVSDGPSAFAYVG